MMRDIVIPLVATNSKNYRFARVKDTVGTQELFSSKSHLCEKSQSPVSGR